MKKPTRLAARTISPWFHIQMTAMILAIIVVDTFWQVALIIFLSVVGVMASTYAEYRYENHEYLTRCK